MKKHTKFLLAVLLLLVPVAIFAQDVVPTTGFDIMTLFTSFASFAAGVLVITGLVTQYVIKNLSNLGRSITSWVIAAIIGFIGWFLQLGIFAGIEWWNVLAIVVSFAAGSNVIYNVEWIRNLFSRAKIVAKKVQ